MKNNKILIGIALLAAVILSLLWRWYFDAGAQKLSVSTDKTEYNSDGVLKVAVQNNSRRNICFSSCYPYYFEKKNSNFEPYSYRTCQAPNLNQVCVEPNQSKFFEIALPPVEAGLHRLAIPACVGCKIKNNFREDKKFYSNEFVVK